jgi:hypothetical protein
MRLAVKPMTTLSSFQNNNHQKNVIIQEEGLMKQQSAIYNEITLRTIKSTIYIHRSSSSRVTRRKH